MQRLSMSLCGYLCACALFMIMALTFLDVLGRRLFSHSIPGSLELTELLMVVVIFAALPLVSQRREHVVFDSLDAYVPALWRRWHLALVDVVCGLALAGLALLMWRPGNDFLDCGEPAAQLHILKAPFIYGMAALCGATAVVHLLAVFQAPGAVAGSSEVNAL